MLREAPPKLLGDFESHGLRTLGVVAAEIDIGESPSELVRDLCAQPIYVVVIAADADEMRTKDRGSQNLAEFEIVRDEHVALETKPRCVRRDAVGEIARRRASKDVESEFHRPRCRHRYDAIFVRQGRMIDGVVLDVQLLQAQAPGETIGANERGITGVESRAWLAGNRQQFPEAPHIARAPLDYLAGERVANRVVVVFDFEGTQTLIADPQRLCREFRPTEMALQPCHERHA